jgi:pimeloyl-ACP methyl ester carboxylesterase
MDSTRLTIRGADDLLLAADVLGADGAPPVVLAHGAGQTRYAWRRAGEQIASAGYRAVLFDLRGHGDSQWASDGEYGIEAFTGDCIQIARWCGTPPAFIGASLGGIAGLMSEGLVAPGTFSSLTLVDIAPNMDASGAMRILGFMGTHVENGFATLQEAADVIASFLPHRTRPTDLSGLEKNLRLSADGRYRWHWDPRMLEGFAGAGDPNRSERLVQAARNLRLPVHLVRGQSSELVSEEGARQFLELVPTARFTDVPRAHHMVAGDRNDAFIDAVLAFLASLRSREVQGPA